MKNPLALWLIAAGLHAQAAELPPCDDPVRFSAGWFADPEMDNGKSIAELRKLVPASGSGTPLGHVVVETRLATLPQPTCRGLAVRLDYIQPVLRVASEFQPGSCAYAHVMAHELAHVRIHRDIARQFRELRYPWRAAGAAAVLAYARQELDRLMRAHTLFDSPEEYASNHGACSGDIARLLRPAAASTQGTQKSG